MNELAMNGALLEIETLNKLIIGGDLSALSPAQKIEYYTYRCRLAGLDPACKPFDLLTLSGKQVLYANAACAQQLTAKHGLSVKIVSATAINDVYAVNAEVSSNGRSTANVGCVTIATLKGDALCNAMMKATTKAIRRAVLAHCSLGMLDESENETIPDAAVQPIMQPRPKPAPVAATVSAGKPDQSNQPAAADALTPPASIAADVGGGSDESFENAKPATAAPAPAAAAKIKAPANLPAGYKTYTGPVEEVKTKTGTGTKGDWQWFGIIGEGNLYSTFDRDYGARAQEAQQTGEIMLINYSEEPSKKDATKINRTIHELRSITPEQPVNAFDATNIF